LAGSPKNFNTTFLLTDSEVKKEEFLEFLNSFLLTGEIAGLLPKDEKEVACIEIKQV